MTPAKFTRKELGVMRDAWREVEHVLERSGSWGKAARDWQGAAQSSARADRCKSRLAQFVTFRPCARFGRIPKRHSFTFKRREIMQKIPVVFRRLKEGDVIALFPTLPARPGMCKSYQHFGQYGAASRALVRVTKPARVEAPDVANLLAELTYIYTTRPGDNPKTYGEPVELVIRQRMPRA